MTLNTTQLNNSQLVKDNSSHTIAKFKLKAQLSIDYYNYKYIIKLEQAYKLYTPLVELDILLDNFELTKQTQQTVLTYKKLYDKINNSMEYLDCDQDLKDYITELINVFNNKTDYYELTNQENKEVSFILGNYYFLLKSVLSHLQNYDNVETILNKLKPYGNYYKITHRILHKETEIFYTDLTK